MKNKLICEKCGTEMVNRSSKDSIYVECPKCRWGWATTTYDSTYDDNTKYEVWLMPGNFQNTDRIRLISEISNINYLQAKKAFKSESPVMIFKAHNDDVISLNMVQQTCNIARKLTNAGIEFSIVPEFRYEF